MRHLSGYTKRHQVLCSGTRRHRVRHVGQSLRRLADWNRRNHLVGHSIDGSDGVLILQSDIDTGAIVGRPDINQFISKPTLRRVLKRRFPKEGTDFLRALLQAAHGGDHLGLEVGLAGHHHATDGVGLQVLPYEFIRITVG
jgi:hypothetical protein